MIENKIRNPEISVVMSVFNGEEFLKEAIESVLNQNFTNFEFIIIDDCSTDKTNQILKKYEKSDERIILIEKSINKGFKGFVENLNLGISKSRGKYIARMDADDLCLPERFQLEFEYLEKHKEVFLVGTSMLLINEKNEITGKMEALTEFDSILKRTKIDNPIYHPTIMFRNEPDLYYREKFYACEDFDFHLRMISKNRILKNLSEPLLKYRVLESSISRKGNSFIKRLFLEYAKKLYSQRSKSGIDEYDSFVENEFLNILHPDFENKKSYLVFAAHVAILYNKREELNIIIRKLKIQHHYSNLFFNLNRVKIIHKLISFAKRKFR